MSKQSVEMMHYQAWESKTLKNYSELLEKYNSHKEKENAMAELNEGKNSKKDTLLKFKADNTLSKIGYLELDNIEREEVIDSNYRRNIKTIEDIKNNKISLAEKEYERAISIAQDKKDKKIQEAETAFENTTIYYNNENELSSNKCKREYDSKKRLLESRGEQVEQLRTITMKSAADISMDKQKYDMLSKMSDMIGTIHMSRSQIKGIFSSTIPSLPEQFIKKKGMQAAPVHTIESIGEDASLVVLREESRRADAILRRQAHEMEMEKQEKAFQNRRLLDQEAEQRKIRNQEYRKSQELLQAQNSLKNVEEEQEEQEEEM
jgi:hypothetical protein